MTRRIVVGVDGSSNSRLALRRAAEEATAHGTSLEVVPAWNLLDEVAASHFDPHYGQDTARADLQQILKEELDGDPFVLGDNPHRERPSRSGHPRRGRRGLARGVGQPRPRRVEGAAAR